MKTHYNISRTHFKRTVVTVGVFDGLHKGHRVILDMLKREAKALDAESLIFTLHPHPKTVLFPDSEAPKCLMTKSEKEQAMRDAGIDHFVIYPFSKEFAQLTACEFIQDIIVDKLAAKKLIVGYDHRFGSDRQSDIRLLRACAKPLGCTVEKAQAFSADGLTVSSTLIRRALSAGNIREANEYLSYSYSIAGKVVKGDQIGRKIGFPTANMLADARKLLPQQGVYAVKVYFDGKCLSGMLNIGRRPTVTGSGDYRLEVHIFDGHFDLYGKDVRASFHYRIRDEKRFDSLNELKYQLIKDKQVAKELLSTVQALPDTRFLFGG